MKNIALLSIGALALASCAPMMASSTTTPYTLSPQQSASTSVTSGGNNTTGTGNSGMKIMPVGTLSVTNATATSSADATTSTTAKLTGLMPNTYYVAHYHLQGNDNPDNTRKSPCLSNGPLIKSSMLVGMSDASGALTLSGSVVTKDIANATYFNVHTASDSMGTPADGGVSCTPVKI